MKPFECFASKPMAMTEPALRAFVARIAAADIPAEAITAKLVAPRDGQMYVRDGVGVIPVQGPLLWHGDFFTRFFDVRTYEDIALEFSGALSAKAVKSVLFHIDSPGGEAAGVHELGEMIFAGRGVKPVRSYVAGSGDSAAYWIASATQEVIADRSAELGSIGTIAVFMDPRRLFEEMGIDEIVIVSDQSPQKWTDPATQEGFDRIKAWLNSLTDVFVDAVARNRGVSQEKVLADYGKGWIKVGQDAVSAGLADRLGSFESILAELAEVGRVRAGVSGAAATTKPGGRMEPEFTRAQLDAAREEGRQAGMAEGRAAAAAEHEAQQAAAVAAAEERVHGVYSLLVDDEGKPRVGARGHEKVVLEAARKPGVTKAEAALQLIEAREAKETTAAAAKLAGIRGDETALPKPGPGAHAGTGPEAPAEIDRLRAAAEARKPRRARTNGTAPSAN